MSRRFSRCQFGVHPRRALVTAYAVIAIAVLCAGGALAQPGKPEAEAAALAQRTLASSLSVAVDQITIARVLPAEWRDSSLGCPERGMMYAPVLTRGFDVRLRHAEREHTVHVAGGRAVVCSSLPDAKLSPAPVVAASLKAGDVGPSRAGRPPWPGALARANRLGPHRTIRFAPVRRGAGQGDRRRVCCRGPRRIADVPLLQRRCRDRQLRLLDAQAGPWLAVVARRATPKPNRG